MLFDVRIVIELISDIKSISGRMRIIIGPRAWRTGIGIECRGMDQAKGKDPFFAICMTGEWDICKICK
jgi:hypothetical protein